MKRFLSIIFITSIFTSVFAQSPTNDPVLLKIANENITRSEFEKVYKKNNSKDAAFDSQSLHDYLDLFINYKLKVKEAEEMKLDTSQAFVTELSGYRKQLAQPYLTDREVSDHLIKEAYDRLQYDVRASHILIKVAADAMPKDTVEAYNKAMKARERVTKGADFAVVARELSDDPSAKDNGGDLGYFTAMQMVYPFESAAYTNKPGNVSMPVRTNFGYHIIKTIDKRQAQGEVQVAHIMVKLAKPYTTEDSTNAVYKINEIHSKLVAGESFKELAQKYSDDQGSARNEGILPWFGTGRMVPEFEKASFDLKNKGEFSKPFQTSYGFHIVRLVDNRGLPSFEEKQADLKTQIARDSRADVSKKSFVERIKKENNFKEYAAAKEEIFKAVDSTLINGNWKAEKTGLSNKPLFSLGDKTFTQKDFATHLESNQITKPGYTPQMIANVSYNQYVEDKVMAYEESMLDKKYADFRALMQEYRDGILLFDLTDQKVWSKAVQDSTGLKEFYEKNKSSYMWPERVDAVIYTAADAKVASDTKKLLKKKGMTREELLKQINSDSQLKLTIREGKYSKGENDIIDKIAWQKGLSNDINQEGSMVFVDVKEVLPAQPKKLEESRGLVTSDYQSQLEKQWIQSLKNRYSVEVNQEVLQSMIQ
ncbi:MAG: peptidylprolyl isomerase [Bacteroidia bacterium]